MAKEFDPKNVSTDKGKKTPLGLILAPSSTDNPIVYSEDTWDVVESDSDLASVLEGSGQFSQHDINEALAANGGGGAANMTYKYEEGEQQNDKSVFNPATVKGLTTADGIIKVPSYYYFEFTNENDNNFVTINLLNDGKKIGNCPIVQVVHKTVTVENNETIENYSVIYCDFSINVSTGTLTITWSNRITVDQNNPLYISIIG